MSPSDRYYAHGHRAALAHRARGDRAVRVGLGMQAIPKQPPGLRADAFNLHKSIGLTILALMCLRAALAVAASGAAAAARCPRGRRGSRTRRTSLLYVALFVHAARGLPGLGVQRLSGQVLRHHAAGVGMEGRRASRTS